MQRRHPVRHLLWRSGVAAIAQTLMVSGVYPVLPMSLRSIRGPSTYLRGAVSEWAMGLMVTLGRPAGFLPLPGRQVRGPRPIIVLHGYAMNRSNFIPLAYRCARAGIGPMFGFEYWSLGRTAAAARQLGWFVDQVRTATGASQVDLIGHSMGGVVALYYALLAGGDGAAAHLITLGSPLAGTDVSGFGVGHPGRELRVGSKLVERMANAGRLQHTKLTTIWSRADALVPADAQPRIAGAELVVFDDLGHVGMLGSRRVARAIVARLAT
jgi:triacylglycerol esterase/lipase EstA (alpha/beta hydrolase family)